MRCLGPAKARLIPPYLALKLLPNGCGFGENTSLGSAKLELRRRNQSLAAFGI